jgi:thiol-disulfide isomerase/thioredoxin
LLSLAFALLVFLVDCAPQPAPELRGSNGWINSGPLTLEHLRGNVVLVDFWTYSCVNCKRTLPYVKEGHEKYGDRGLVIFGVHTPEFEFKKVKQNVAEAVVVHGLEHPIAQHNNYAIWNSFFNNASPAKYFIDQNSDIQ